MTIRRAMGTLTPIIYFVNRDGNISLPPVSDCPTPRGYERREAGTLAEVDALQSRLQDQERRQLEEEHMLDEARWGAVRQRVSDNLRQRMVSADTSPYERDFISAYLELREEKRAKYQQRFSCDLAARSVLEIREFDRPRTLEERLKG